MKHAPVVEVDDVEVWKMATTDESFHDSDVADEFDYKRLEYNNKPKRAISPQTKYMRLLSS